MLTKPGRRATAWSGTIGPLGLLLAVNPTLAYILLVSVLALAAGILLPAVWSRRGSRRTAAIKVVHVILCAPPLIPAIGADGDTTPVAALNRRATTL